MAPSIVIIKLIKREIAKDIERGKHTPSGGLNWGWIASNCSLRAVSLSVSWCSILDLKKKITFTFPTKW
jgi:hypothetical protein